MRHVSGNHQRRKIKRYLVLPPEQPVSRKTNKHQRLRKRKTRTKAGAQQSRMLPARSRRTRQRRATAGLRGCPQTRKQSSRGGSGGVGEALKAITKKAFNRIGPQTNSFSKESIAANQASARTQLQKQAEDVGTAAAVVTGANAGVTATTHYIRGMPDAKADPAVLKLKYGVTDTSNVSEDELVAFANTQREALFNSQVKLQSTESVLSDMSSTDVTAKLTGQVSDHIGPHRSQEYMQNYLTQINSELQLEGIGDNTRKYLENLQTECQVAYKSELSGLSELSVATSENTTTQTATAFSYDAAQNTPEQIQQIASDHVGSAQPFQEAQQYYTSLVNELQNPALEESQKAYLESLKAACETTYKSNHAAELVPAVPDPTDANVLSSFEFSLPADQMASANQQHETMLTNQYIDSVLGTQTEEQVLQEAANHINTKVGGYTEVQAYYDSIVTELAKEDTLSPVRKEYLEQLKVACEAEYSSRITNTEFQTIENGGSFPLELTASNGTDGTIQVREFNFADATGLDSAELAQSTKDDVYTRVVSAQEETVLSDAKLNAGDFWDENWLNSAIDFANVETVFEAAANFFSVPNIGIMLLYRVASNSIIDWVVGQQTTRSIASLNMANRVLDKVTGKGSRFKIDPIVTGGGKLELNIIKNNGTITDRLQFHEYGKSKSKQTFYDALKKDEREMKLVDPYCNVLEYYVSEHGKYKAVEYKTNESTNDQVVQLKTKADSRLKTMKQFIRGPGKYIPPNVNRMKRSTEHQALKSPTVYVWYALLRNNCESGKTKENKTALCMLLCHKYYSIRNEPRYAIRDIIRLGTLDFFMKEPDPTNANKNHTDVKANLHLARPLTSVSGHLFVRDDFPASNDGKRRFVHMIPALTQDNNGHKTNTGLQLVKTYYDITVCIKKNNWQNLFNTVIPSVSNQLITAGSWKNCTMPVYDSFFRSNPNKVLRAATAATAQRFMNVLAIPYYKYLEDKELGRKWKLMNALGNLRKEIFNFKIAGDKGVKRDLKHTQKASSSLDYNLKHIVANSNKISDLALTMYRQKGQYHYLDTVLQRLNKTIRNYRNIMLDDQKDWKNNKEGKDVDKHGLQTEATGTDDDTNPETKQKNTVPVPGCRLMKVGELPSVGSPSSTFVAGENSMYRPPTTNNNKKDSSHTKTPLTPVPM